MKECLEISIKISEPWDIYELNNNGKLNGKIEKIYKKDKVQILRMLIKLTESITYKEVNYSYLVASPRYCDEDIQAICDGKEIACSMIGIPDNKSDSKDPIVYVDKWRGGGLTLIATLKLTN